MFNKLITNLAFSPSTIEQISFYSKRLKQEESIRRVGFALIILSMFIQMFAAMVPTERSLAASSNDVIYGGVSSLSELKKQFNDKADVRALYKRFGIEAKDITNSGVSNQTFDFQKQGAKGTRTVGRINFTSTKDRNLGSFAGTTFYSRSASEWQGKTQAYYFGKHKGTDGKYYLVWVLKDCGNIAYRQSTPPNTTTEPEPEPEPSPTPEPVLPPPSTPVPTPTPETPVTPQEPVCPNNPELKPDDVLCKCPDKPEITADHPDCEKLGLGKVARNITQGLTPEQTIGAKVKAGDVIEYTLTTYNNNVAPKTGYVVEDYIGDLLDYSDLEAAFLMRSDGSYSAQDKMVKWPPQTIPANSEIKNVFRVKIKSVIPSTNVPNATAGDYDCVLQNGYGNETKLMVDCPVIKTVETLPNTGPGTTLVLAFTASVVSGYFFMRSRLLAKEIGIVKKSYQAGH